MKTGGRTLMVSPCKAVASPPSQKTSVALEQLQQQAQDMEGSNEFRVSASSSKKRRVEEGRGQPVAAAAAQEAQDWCPQGSSEEANGRGEADSGGKLRGWAPPGLGVCQLWAQQASSLKKKKGASPSASFSPCSFPESSPLPASSERRHRAAVAVGFGIDDAVPATREDKAKLVGGYLGTSRPGYGDASRTPVWWPAEVPWLKGVSISQMNNATLHTLVLAVKAHQRRERREALASGGDLPDGLFTFTPKTKKEMSRLIRSIQGRRLEYGKEGKRPAWWPKSCPWDNHKPLSTMKHAEVTSVFKAMVREGLLSDSDVNAASCSTSPLSGTGECNNGNDRAADSQGEDGGDTTSDNDCQRSGGGDGGGGRGGRHHPSTNDSGSEHSSFWDGDDDGGAVGGVTHEVSPLCECETIDPNSAEDLDLPVPVRRATCGLMPSWKQQDHSHQLHLAQQQQQQPLEFHGGGLGLDAPPVLVAPTTATFPEWPQPLGKSSVSSPYSHAKVGSSLVPGQVGTCSSSTVAPPLLESVSCSPTKLPPTAATPKADEESAWQGRALFEELLFGGPSAPQSCGFHGEDDSTERMFRFNPVDDDLVFAVGGHVSPLQ